MNVNKLKGKIVENEMNVSELAKEMHIDRATLYRKLNSKGESFTIKEANLIVKILNLSVQEAMDIFFKDTVASGATNTDNFSYLQLNTEWVTTLITQIEEKVNRLWIQYLFQKKPNQQCGSFS